MGRNTNADRMLTAAETVIANGGTRQQADNAAYQQGAHLTREQLLAVKAEAEAVLAKHTSRNN